MMVSGEFFLYFSIHGQTNKNILPCFDYCENVSSMITFYCSLVIFSAFMKEIRCLFCSEGVLYEI